DGMDGAQVALEPRAVERRLVQVLRGADESARLTPHRTHQRPEVPTRLWREEHQHLFRARRNSELQALLGAAALPGLAGVEPALRRRVRGAAQKADDEQVVLRLGGRQV